MRVLGHYDAYNVSARVPVQTNWRHCLPSINIATRASPMCISLVYVANAERRWCWRYVRWGEQESNPNAGNSSAKLTVDRFCILCCRPSVFDSINELLIKCKHWWHAASTVMFVLNMVSCFNRYDFGAVAIAGQIRNDTSNRFSYSNIYWRFWLLFVCVWLQFCPPALSPPSPAIILNWTNMIL